MVPDHDEMFRCRTCGARNALVPDEPVAADVVRVPFTPEPDPVFRVGEPAGDGDADGHVQVACSSCGAFVSPARICASCGTALPGEAHAPDPEPLQIPDAGQHVDG
jgi:hypothetical protein